MILNWTAEGNSLSRFVSLCLPPAIAAGIHIVYENICDRQKGKKKEQEKAYDTEASSFR